MNKKVIAISFILGLMNLLPLAAFAGGAPITYTASDHAELVSAIAAAADGDIIDITQDITVSAEVEITKTLNIEGNGHTVSVPVPALDDSGVINPSGSVMRVFYSNASGKTITMHDLTIKGGRPSGFGGGIYNAEGTILKLTGSTISNSSASTGGGGLLNRGVVYLKDSDLSRNAASYGGGFLNDTDAQMFIENSTVSENRSTSFAGGGGAGENKGSLYANNSTFSNNKSTELGGAINNYTGTFYAVNSTFTGNVAYGSFEGGAIANNGGSVTAINSIFAYNYKNTGTSSVPIYALSDIYKYNGSNANAYYCIFQASDSNSVNAHTSNMTYSRLADGSDNTIFAGGATTKVLAADGSEIGTNTVFQPLLMKAGATSTAVVNLKAGSPALAAGTRTGFTNGSGTPIIGFFLISGNCWQHLTGGDSSSHVIIDDQNYNVRTATPAVGAAETTATTMYMLKVSSAANGTVEGGTVYGDTYTSGTSVTLTATADSGYSFVRWDYVLGGSGTASTSDTFAVTVNKSITLVPVFQLSVPTAPSGATTSAITTSSIAFGWTDNSDNETSFVAGYSLDGSHYTEWDELLAGTTSRSLTGAIPDTEYWFRVAASNGTGTSAYAATTGIYTLAVAPTSVSAIADSSTAITVSWSGGIASGYQVSFSGGNSGWVTTSSYQVTGLIPGTSYTFSVKAKNGDAVETGAISVTASTLNSGGVFIVPVKPIVTDRNITVFDSSIVSFDNLPPDITQLSVSTDPDFADASWENISKQYELIKQYANASKLYIKFRTGDGGVSDVIVYEGSDMNQILNDGDIVKTADNFDVYIIKLKNNKQYKRLILSPSVFNSYQHLQWGNIKIISQTQLDRYVTSSLVKETTDVVIYELTPNGDIGKRKPFDVSTSYDVDSVYEINAVDRDSYELVGE